MGALTQSPAPWQRVGPEHPCCHVAGVQDSNGGHVADVVEEQDVDVIVAAPSAAARFAEIEAANTRLRDDVQQMRTSSGLWSGRVQELLEENTRLKNSLSSVEEDLRVVRLQLLGRLGPQPLDLARENTSLREALERAVAFVEGAIRVGELDPRNGNTADNGVDEGEVAWSGMLHDCKVALGKLRNPAGAAGSEPNGSTALRSDPEGQPPRSTADRCVGFEPHPMAMYAEEFCVAPVYDAKPGETMRPHFCSQPRSAHAEVKPAIDCAPPAAPAPSDWERGE